MPITAAALVTEFTTHGVPKTTSDIKNAGAAVDGFGSAASGAEKKSRGFFSTMAATAGGFLLASAVTAVKDNVVGFGASLINANADIETYKNQLEIATGSTEKATRVFDAMRTMAAESPFEFPELIDAAQQLESLGFASEHWMPIIGDASAATGKSIDQVTQAVMDASTGEFERLKELGIRTQVNGDKIAFSFMKNGKMMTVEAENTQEGIQAALGGIWEDKYAGAMDKLANTYRGRMATLKDNINMALQDAGKPLFEMAKSALGFANAWFEAFDDLRGKGVAPFTAAMQALEGVVEKAFGTGAAKLVSSFATMLESAGRGAKKVAGLIKDGLGRAFELLSRHMGTVLPALKGIGIAIAAMAGMGLITGIVAGLVGALALLLSPITLIIAAAALLSVAWSKNWGDIQGKTASVVAFIKQHLTQIIDVVAAMAGPVGVAILTIVKHWDELVQAFKADGLMGALKAFGAAFKTELAGVLTTIMSIVDAIRNVDWGGFLSGAWSAIQAGLQFAWQQLSAIDWSQVIGKAVEVGSRIVAWAKETLGSIDWGRIIGQAKNVGLAVFDWISGQLVSIDWGRILGAAKNVGLSVFDWIAGQLVSIDWARILGAAVEVGSKVFTWARDTLGAIDWGRIVGKAKNIGLAVFDWVVGQLVSIDWGRIVGSVKEIGAGIFGWIKGLLVSISWTELFGDAIDLGKSILDWIKGALIIPVFTMPSPGEIKDAIVAAITGGGGTEGGDYSGIGVSGEGVDPNDPSTWPGSPGKQPFMQGNLSETGKGPGVSFDTKGASNLIAMLAQLRDGLATTQAAFVGFVANTIGVMGGWTGGLTTMLTTVTIALTTRTNVATIAAQASIVTFVANTIGVMGGWSGGLTTITTTAMATMQSRVSSGTAAAKASFLAFVSASIGVMGGWSGGITTNVSTTMSMMQSRTSSGTAAAKGSFVAFVSSTIGVMGGWSGGVQNIVSGAMSGMVSRAASGAAQMAAALRNGANDGASAVQGALGRIPGIVASIGGSAAATAYSIGANISHSFASGMYSALGAINAAANAMVNAADTALRAKARIASPSKLFAALGEHVGEGFEQGIRAKIPDVARASAALVGTPSLGDYGISAIPAYASAAARQAPVINNITYKVITVPPDEWVRIAREAERGGSFAKARSRPDAITQYVRGERR